MAKDLRNYLDRYERAQEKLWELGQKHRADPTDARDRRLVQHTLALHRALMRYVKPTPAGYKLRGE